MNKVNNESKAKLKPDEGKNKTQKQNQNEKDLFFTNHKEKPSLFRKEKKTNQINMRMKERKKMI